jgi:tRNA threonylcarbamoyladenosine biosynthesis protein TsaE
VQLFADTPGAMEQLGGRLAALAYPGMQIHLSGDLGAGKTTFVRGFLRGLGYDGTVKSPTYTLVESYPLHDFTVYHFDFYRVKHPDEIEAIGFRDYQADGAICLIEWPEMAGQTIGSPDLLIRFSIINEVRQLELVSATESSKLLISKISQAR